MSEEPPSIYAKRILNAIETNATNRDNRLVLELSQSTTTPINLEIWTKEFIRLFNEKNRIGLEDEDKIPTEPSSSHGLIGIDNTTKTQFLQEYHNTKDQADHPFIGATIVNSIGDGTCLIHSCFNALSETYRGLEEKYQQLIGLFFRKHIYAESSLLNHHQKARVKQLFADKDRGISLENTFLDDTDVRNLARLFGKNILVFQERKNPVSKVQENQCRYFRVNDGPAICLYLQGETHYDTIQFPDNTFERPDEWSKEHFGDAYEVEPPTIPDALQSSSEPIDPTDIFLREVTQFIGEQPTIPLTPSTVLLDAVTHFIAPKTHSQLKGPDNDDNMSDLSNDEENSLSNQVEDIYDELNEYLNHIYKIMQKKKQAKQTESTSTDTSSTETSSSTDTTSTGSSTSTIKTEPTTIENNTACHSNRSISVEIQTVQKDQFGNEVLNTTECA